MNNKPKTAQDVLLGLFEHVYVTAIQDERGVASNRKDYRMRYDEIPQVATKEALKALQELVEGCMPDEKKKEWVDNQPQISYVIGYRAALEEALEVFEQSKKATLDKYGQWPIGVYPFFNRFEEELRNKFKAKYGGKG